MVAPAQVSLTLSITLSLRVILTTTSGLSGFNSEAEICRDMYGAKCDPLRGADLFVFASHGAEGREYPNVRENRIMTERISAKEIVTDYCGADIRP